MEQNKYNIAFFGTPSFSVPILEALHKSDIFKISLVITQIDKPSGRGQLVQGSPIKEFAIKHNLNLLQPEKIISKKNTESAEKFQNELDKYKPYDAAVLVAYGQVLPPWVLEYFNDKCINVHASLLPRWRGAAPIQRSIMEGDSKTGISIMKMDNGLDTGPVYSMESIDIDNNTSFSELYNQLSIIGAKVLLRDLPSILRGDLKPKLQSHEGLSYAHKIEAQDAVINWEYSSKRICRQIRALWPKPGAYTSYKEKRLKIAQATNSEREFDSQNKFQPGEVVYSDNETCEVKCGDGIISILSLQLEGKQVTPIKEFLKGNQIEKGTIFSSNKRI